jgi:hypothetical protein
MTNNPTKKKYNSSIEAAAVTLGVHPCVIDMYLPLMIETTQTINEQNKTKGNREGVQTA